MDFLKWQAGLGWLIFSGGNVAGSPLRAKALMHARADGHIAYISFADDLGDALMDDMEDLGAPSGYLVDIVHEEIASVREQLEEASVVVIEIGASVDALYRALKPSGIVNALQSAYENGAVFLIEGLAGNVFGRWMISDQGMMFDGLNWVVNAFIEPESASVEDSRAVQAILEAQSEAIAINIAHGSALALGPGGAVQLWGEQKVTISLGKSYTT